MVRQITRDGVACKGSFVVDSAAIRKGDIRANGKGLPVVDSDRCPCGDFGVALQCDVAYQSGRGLLDGAAGQLLAPDKQAFTMIIYPGSRRVTLVIRPVDGYDKGV